MRRSLRRQKETKLVCGTACGASLPVGG